MLEIYNSSRAGSEVEQMLYIWFISYQFIFGRQFSLYMTCEVQDNILQANEIIV
jgi:hypothetical protein